MIGQFRAPAQRGVRSGGVVWFLGEFFVVTISVLIAFALNAWWVERNTRAEEQTHLRALARDFEENVEVFEVLLEREEGIVKATLELLQLARKQPDAEAAVVRPLMGGVFTSLRVEPALDAYDALVNSAGLTLISNEGLRSDLAGFAARVTNPYSGRFSDQLYMAFTTRFVGRLHISGIVAQDASQEESYAEVLGDPAFQEHLALRHLTERDVAADYRQRLREAQGILEQLRAQIER